MPLESTIVERVKKALRSIDTHAKIVKTNGDGEPDLFASVNGIAVLVECKQPGEKPKPLQRQRIAEWNRSEAFAYWTDDAETYHPVVFRGVVAIEIEAISLATLEARIKRRVALSYT